MAKNANTQDPAEVKNLVDRLTDTIGRIDHDDLTQLAQMHGWCLSLAESASKGEPLAEQAAHLTRSLESLIIGDTADAGDAFKAITSQVAQLTALVAPLVGDAAESRAFGPDASPTDVADAAASAGPSSLAEALPPPAAPATEPPPAEAALAPTTCEPTQPEPEAAAVVACEKPYESVPLTIGEREMEYVRGFIEEGSEHIQAIESALLEVERAPDDTAKIDDLFRPFHTIKGLAGFLNLRDVNCLTHEAETLLDQARKGTRRITPALIDLIFDVVDIVKVQIGAIATHVMNPQGDVIPQPPVSDMIGKLRAVVAGRLQPEQIQTAASATSGRTGETLVAQKAVPQEVVDFALDLQKTQPGAKTGELLVKMGAATSRQVGQALRSQAEQKQAVVSATPASNVADLSVRIDTAKLDSLIDMVGELVIAQTLVAGNPAVSGDTKLARDSSQVTKIVRDVQELAMAMRMVPIASTFQKMERLMRDLSRKGGKTIELAISGQQTELDKNVIQQISDPLVHMIRNAVDHAIEPAEEREAAGKDPVGHVRLAAFHQGGNIVVEIADDGRGLDAKRLVAKAVERGLVAPDAELTDQQAFALIFAPGFSTAEKVTDISGRGVGMDVVKRNIEQLRGKIDIRSEKGKGTTFSIRLPLTLAIIDGMIVRVGEERFIIPTINIEQALRPTPRQITTIQHRGEVIDVRGRLVPVVQLGENFRLSPRVDPCQAMVVVVRSDDEPVAVVVDELIGQQQVVIKSLGQKFQKLRGISGAAILGDGRVGLILEMTGLGCTHRAGNAA